MSYDGIVPAVGQLLAFLVSKPFLVVQVVISCANSKVINLISVQWLESYFLNVIIVLCPYLVFFFLQLQYVKFQVEESTANPNFKCPYSISSNQHPFISLLRYDNTLLYN